MKERSQNGDSCENKRRAGRALRSALLPLRHLLGSGAFLLFACVICGFKFASSVVNMDFSSPWAEGHQQDIRKVFFRGFLKRHLCLFFSPGLILIYPPLFCMLFPTNETCPVPKVTLPSGQCTVRGGVSAAALHMTCWSKLGATLLF